MHEEKMNIASSQTAQHHTIVCNVCSDNQRIRNLLHLNEERGREPGAGETGRREGGENVLARLVRACVVDVDLHSGCVVIPTFLIRISFSFFDQPL